MRIHYRSFVNTCYEFKFMHLKKLDDNGNDDLKILEGFDSTLEPDIY